jgi:hypothetical protein
VVLVPLELPGARWVQQNNGQFDDRLWSERRYWDQAAAFWRDLARALDQHAAIAAYNLVNEPVPERRGGLEEHAAPETMQSWYRTARGTTRDLPAFYEKLVGAVREVDRTTPLMLDAGFYAAADAWSYWPAGLSDPRILYAYHMYEPWSATSAPNMKRKVPYRYPGDAPFGAGEAHWDARVVAGYLRQTGGLGPAARHPEQPPGRRGVRLHAPVARLCAVSRRRADGARSRRRALGVLFVPRILGRHGLRARHEKLPWQYWEAVDQGKPYPLKRGPNKLFEPILRRLR